MEGGDDGQGNGAVEGGQGVEGVVEEDEGNGQEEDEAVFEGAVGELKVEVEAGVGEEGDEGDEEEGVTEDEEVYGVLGIGSVHEEVGVGDQFGKGIVDVEVDCQADVGGVKGGDHEEVVGVTGGRASLTRDGHLGSGGDVAHVLSLTFEDPIAFVGEREEGGGVVDLEGEAWLGD